MSKIVDTVILNNEIDLLELRCKIMGDKVDRIVVVESDHTFTGKPKAYNLERELSRFDQWKDKLVYLKVKNENPSRRSWDNEHWQRDQMNQGWTDLGDEDVIIMGDLDELVRPAAIDLIRNTNYALYHLHMPTSYFRFNYMDLHSHYSPWVKAVRGYQLSGSRMRTLPNVPNGVTVKVHHAGWHFSWLGDDEFVKEKLRSFSHTEFDTDAIHTNLNIEEHIKNGDDHLMRGHTTWRIVDIDDYFPKEILENKEQYKNLILPNSGINIRDYWKNGMLEIEEVPVG